MKAPPHRILVARNDRLGDWVLTLPLVDALAAAFPTAVIEAMAPLPLADFLSRYEKIKEVLPSPTRTCASVVRAARDIRRRRYDAAVVVHPAGADALAIWLARVPVRVGNGYRGYSFLFNRPVFFHRHPSDRHETEYNILYLRGFGVAPPREVSPPRLTVNEGDISRARRVLADAGVPAGDYVVVHPGCGGSSLNWSPQRYRAFVTELARTTGLPVVVTGSANEADLAAFVAGEGVGRYNVAGKTDYGALLAILAGAKLFISGNTGPMHLAAAVGTSTVSLFSPLRSGSPRRWGPRGNAHEVIQPAGVACERCPGRRCERYNCMEAITLEEVLAAARRLLAAKRRA